MKILLTLFVLLFSSSVVAEGFSLDDNLTVEAKKYLQSKNLILGMNSSSNEEYFFINIYRGSIENSICEIYYDIAQRLGESQIEGTKFKSIHIVNSVTVEGSTYIVEKSTYLDDGSIDVEEIFEENIKLTKGSSSLECKTLSKIGINNEKITSTFVSSSDTSDAQIKTIEDEVKVLKRIFDTETKDFISILYMKLHN